MQRNCVFRLRGLSHDMQTLAANLIQLPLSVIRAKAGQRDKLRMVIFFDEAKILIGKDKFTRPATGVPLAKQLWTQMRGLGVGLVYADNVPTGLAQFVKSNTNILFYFRQRSPSDIREALQATGAQERHKPHFFDMRAAHKTRTRRRSLILAEKVRNRFTALRAPGRSGSASATGD